MADPDVVDLTGEYTVAPSRQATVDRNKAKQPAVIVDLTGDDGYQDAATQVGIFVPARPSPSSHFCIVCFLPLTKARRSPKVTASLPTEPRIRAR